MILLLYYICMIVASMCTGDKNSLLNAVGWSRGERVGGRERIGQRWRYGLRDYHAIMVKASGMRREGCVGVASN